MIAEGRDRVLDYVNGGNIRELNDIVPHIDQSECIRRFRALSLLKIRGRQVCYRLHRKKKKINFT